MFIITLIIAGKIKVILDQLRFLCHTFTFVPNKNTRLNGVNQVVLDNLMQNLVEEQMDGGGDCNGEQHDISQFPGIVQEQFPEPNVRKHAALDNIINDLDVVPGDYQ